MRSCRQVVGLLLIVCAAIVSAGCKRKLTPQEVENGLLALENKNQSPYKALVASFQCRYGERDWEYICLARYEPTPFGLSRGQKVIVQKQGIRHAFLYEGMLGGSITPLPDDGPTPSSAELQAMRKKEYEALLERNAAREAEKLRKERPGWTPPPPPPRVK